MKLRFEVSRLANQFFFVSNLAEWHFSCRPEYNRAWLDATGELTHKEKESLAAFKEILQKYGFVYDKQGKSIYLGNVFYSYPPSVAWEGLKKRVGQQEFEKIHHALKIFEPRFRKAWDSAKKHNQRALRDFKITLKSQQHQQLLHKTEKLFFGKSFPHEIAIVVLWSPLGAGETAAGGANLERNAVTLELPRLEQKTWQLEYSIMVMMHELAHFLFEKRHGWKTIAMIMHKLRLPRHTKDSSLNTVGIMNEAMTDSFLPYGALAQKYSCFELADILLSKLNEAEEAPTRFASDRKISYRRLEKYFVWKLYPVAARYVKEGKMIDGDYLMEVGKILRGLYKK